MFAVTRTANDRLDLNVGGKLDTDDATQLIHTLFREAAGITGGRMLIDVDAAGLPSLGAAKIEFARLPELFHFLRQFAHVAVLADEKWLRAIADIESKLMPGLVIKTFRKDQRYHAETWLAQCAARAG